MLEAPGEPLRERELPDPVPGRGEVLLRVSACGVCRTDLHVVDGELAEPKLPLVLGHQIVATVAGPGEGAERFAAGRRASGCPGSAGSCGECRFCRSGRENLCVRAEFTGYTLDGGYAELAVADERFCFPIPDGYPDLQAAPLLCAGLIGYRSLRMTGDAERLGLYGFGAAAHIDLPGRGAPGAPRVRLHPRPATRRRRRWRASWERSGLERPRSAPRRSTRPSSSPPSASWSRRRSRAARPGRDGGLRGHPHERHPVVPLRTALGGAAAPLGGEPDAARTARSSWLSRRGSRSAPRCRPTRWRTQLTHWTTFAAVGFAAPPYCASARAPAEPARRGRRGCPTSP